jgi:hypothetical protein
MSPSHQGGRATRAHAIDECARPRPCQLAPLRFAPSQSFGPLRYRRSAGVNDRSRQLWFARRFRPSLDRSFGQKGAADSFGSPAGLREQRLPGSTTHENGPAESGHSPPAPSAALRSSPSPHGKPTPSPGVACHRPSLSTHSTSAPQPSANADARRGPATKITLVSASAIAPLAAATVTPASAGGE